MYGIDLGTTHITVAKGRDTLSIPQINEEGIFQPRPLLPSVCYLEPSQTLVGAWALQKGREVPTRLIQSSKSWLCHAASDRRAPILPVEAADRRISPVEVAEILLRHLQSSFGWDDEPLVLTIPASFDEAARSLTVEAARKAGLRNLTLLEEPQAAFYSWLAQHEEDWQEHVKPGQNIVVVDVGGGTTDFSVIQVQETGFIRTAVGDHLLLGGDNMDEAIAHLIPIEGEWGRLRLEARRAKEKLLSGQETFQITLQGRGAQIIKKSATHTLQRTQVEPLLLNGFFGQISFEEGTQIPPKKALRTMGLPYEEEPSISKHLAAFLHKYGVKPHFILFNGGVFKAEIFQTAILENLKRWFGAIEQLPSASLDHAVARGAAYYARARGGVGIRIGGGLPRTLYLNVQHRGESKALCLLQRGAEEGSSYSPPEPFQLKTNTPASFHLLSSQVRVHDRPGEIVSIDPLEIQPLSPLLTSLKRGHVPQEIAVRLKASLTPLGTVALALVHETHTWELEYSTRHTEARTGETLSTDIVEKALQTVHALFLQQAFKSSELMERLEKEIGILRSEWPLALLRALADACLAISSPKSPTLNERWWNLLGFAMRPGFGAPLDDYRLKQVWKVILGGVPQHVQYLIALRRMAGGFSRGQQQQIASNLDLTDSEQLRVFASLEWIDPERKIKVGESLLKTILYGDPKPHHYWALARIGARQLLYAAPAFALTSSIIAPWVEKLLSKPSISLLTSLARPVDQPELNLPTSLIVQIPFPLAPYTSQEWEQSFGDTLPPGLTIL